MTGMNGPTPTRQLASALAAGAGVMSVAAFRARRRRRLRGAAKMLHDTVSPRADAELVDLSRPPRRRDESHAPGHRHLGRPPRIATPRPRVFSPDRADRRGHPGRGC